MKASFFVISDYINNSNKQMLIEAVQNGHQLCNHGKTNSMHALKSKSSLTNEILSCDLLIEQLYNEAKVDLPKYKIYRPGCGLFNVQMLNYMKRNNYHLTLGSVYPNDPLFRFPYLNYLYLINHIENGDIVILHDRPWTALMLEKLIKYMNDNNYVSTTLDNLF